MSTQKYIIEEQTLIDIADAIREKEGSEQPIQVSDFSTRIENLSGGAELNIFVQTTQPSTYNGIWIQSDSFIYDSVVEVTDVNSLQASAINFVKGTGKNIILFDDLTYYFNLVYITDSNGGQINNVSIYYGDGEQWQQTTALPKLTANYTYKVYLYQPYGNYLYLAFASNNKMYVKTNTTPEVLTSNPISGCYYYYLDEATKTWTYTGVSNSGWGSQLSEFNANSYIVHAEYDVLDQNGNVYFAKDM